MPVTQLVTYIMQPVVTYQLVPTVTYQQVAYTTVQPAQQVAPAPALPPVPAPETPVAPRDVPAQPPPVQQALPQQGVIMQQGVTSEVVDVEGVARKLTLRERWAAYREAKAQIRNEVVVEPATSVVMLDAVAVEAQTRVRARRGCRL
jgi:hypothetical protein